MDAAALERILSDIVGQPNMLLVAGEPDAIAELELRPGRVEIKRQGGGWLAIEAEGWHMHLAAGRVARIVFRRAPDPHDRSREAFYASLKDAEGRSVLRFFFCDCYDEAGRLLEDRLEPFHALRARYGAEAEASA